MASRRIISCILHGGPRCSEVGIVNVRYVVGADSNPDRRPTRVRGERSPRDLGMTRNFSFAIVLAVLVPRLCGDVEARFRSCGVELELKVPRGSGVNVSDSQFGVVRYDSRINLRV